VAAKDLTGLLFGRLSVVERIASTAAGKAQWLCFCSCGNRRVVVGSHLLSGNTTSCGCFGGRFRHGESTSAESRVWRSMRDRCRNPRRPEYPRYGGRGIRVCERWDDFALFLADLGKRPSPKHELDRIDTNGHYEPSNCRWVTHRQNHRNRRNNVLVELPNGERMLLCEAAERLGWSPHRASGYAKEGRDGVRRIGHVYESR
jgi:hypothetical protein